MLEIVDQSTNEEVIGYNHRKSSLHYILTPLCIGNVTVDCQVHRKRRYVLGLRPHMVNIVRWSKSREMSSLHLFESVGLTTETGCFPYPCFINGDCTSAFQS